MSVTLALKLPKEPVVAELLEGLGNVAVDSGPAGAWRLHIPNVSTRITFLTFTNGWAEVKINSLATAEDVDLALRVTERLAKLAGVSEVDAEMLGTVPIERVRAAFDERWADEQARSGLRALRALIADGRGPIQVPGPKRSYHVGKRVLTELDAAGEEDAHRRMIAAIQKLQWFDEGFFEPASVSLVNGREYAVWEGEPLFFPAVPLAAIDTASKRFFVPAALVPEIAGSRWHWLDERQGLIDACHDWPSVVISARRHEVPG